MTVKLIGQNSELLARLGSLTPLIILAAFAVVFAASPLPAALIVVALIAAAVARQPLQPLTISAIVMLSLCELYFDVAGRTIRAEDVLIFLVLIGMLYPWVTGWRRLTPSRLYRPLVAFIAVLAFSALVAMRQYVSAADKLVATVNAVRIVLAYSVFVIVYNFRADPEKKLSAVINATLLFGFISCGVALLQVLYHQGMLPFPLPTVFVEQQAGANIEWGREIFGPFIGQTGAHMFAFMLSLQALTVFCVAVRERSNMKRALWLSYLGLMVFILARVSVRVALFSLFAACCAILVVEHRTRVRKYASALAVGCTALVVVHYFATHYFDNPWLDRIRVSIPLISEKGLTWQMGTTMLGRFQYWNVAWQMTVEHPVFGVGFSMYGPFSGRAIIGEDIPHPHNGFLHVLCELGLVGFIVFLWLSAVVIREIVRVRREPHPTGLARVADTVLIGALVWLVIANIPATTFLFPKPTIFFWALLAARLALSESERARQAHAPAPAVTAPSFPDDRHES